MDAQALRALLGGPEFAWLRARLRAMVARGRPLTGVLRHASATPAEWEAWARLTGKRPKGGLAVRLGELERLLAEAGHADRLLDAVEALEGPVVAEAAERAARRAAWDAVLTERDPSEVGWLEALRAGGLARRLAGTPDAAGRLLEQARVVRSLLPAQGLLLAELAARATGDAHALDRGTALATIVLRGYSAADREETDEGGATAWRAAWESLGVACDDLSAPVLVLNLPADPDCPLAGAMAAYVALGSPHRISLQQLARGLARFSTGWAGRPVYVCENPAVVAAAADRLGTSCQPLICVEGQPKGAAHRLLSQLAAAGANLMYHGDFDWPGVTIGNLMVRRYGASPWRLGATDYLETPKGKPLEGAPVEALWDSRLMEVMMSMGCSGHEEAILERLLEDLEVRGEGDPPQAW